MNIFNFFICQIGQLHCDKFRNEMKEFVCQNCQTRVAVTDTI